MVCTVLKNCLSYKTQKNICIFAKENMYTYIYIIKMKKETRKKKFLIYFFQCNHMVKRNNVTPLLACLHIKHATEKQK